MPIFLSLTVKKAFWISLGCHYIYLRFAKNSEGIKLFRFAFNSFGALLTAIKPFILHCVNAQFLFPRHNNHYIGINEYLFHHLAKNRFILYSTDSSNYGIQ